MTGRDIRGGAWDYDPRVLRSAIRSGVRPVNRLSILGFRVVVQPSAGHVFRGGSWFSAERGVWSAKRNCYRPEGCDYSLGFRITMDRDTKP